MNAQLLFLHVADSLQMKEWLVGQETSVAAAVVNV
jgi:hypothetical protein